MDTIYGPTVEPKCRIAEWVRSLLDDNKSEEENQFFYQIMAMTTEEKTAQEVIDDFCQNLWTMSHNLLLRFFGGYFLHGQGVIAIHLTDDPKPYEEVNVKFTEISVHQVASIEAPDDPNDPQEIWMIPRTVTPIVSLLVMKNRHIAAGPSATKSGAFCLGFT